MKKKQSTLLFYFILFFIFLSLFIGYRLLLIKDENTLPPIIEGVVQQKSDVVTVHSQPSKNANVLYVLNDQDIVEVLDSIKNEEISWYQIYLQDENIKGWVQSKFVYIVESEEYHIEQ
jgi:hypothetical protein